MLGTRKNPIYATRISRRSVVRRRVAQVLIFAFAFTSIVVFGLTYYETHMTRFTYTSVTVTGADAFPKDDIKQYVESAIAGAYLGLFPKSSMLIYPKSSIEAGLLNAFPRLAVVGLSGADNHMLEAHVLERKPYYLWCGENLPDASAPRPDCYFVDLDGIAFTPAPQFSGPTYFEFYGPIQGDSVRAGNINKKPLGYYVIPGAEFKRVVSFKNALKAQGITANSLLSGDNGDYTLILQNGVKILFNKDRDYDRLAENLIASFDGGTLKEDDLKSPNSKISYVDLRFEDKLYFK